MKRPTLPVLVFAGSAVALAIAAGERAASVDIALLHAGVAVELPAATGESLASSIVAYFETCHTYEAVTGEILPQVSLLETWQGQKSGSHALVTLAARDDSPREPRQLLVGFSPGSPAWPVLSRDREGSIVLHSKCDGLQGSLLACQVGAFIPGAAPPDCERLRDIQRQAPVAGEGAG